MNDTEPAAGGSIPRAFRRWLSLFTPLRFRDFRLFWIGLTAQIVGQQMFQVTVGWLAYDLTGSPAALGLINLVGFVPRVTLTLLGGVFADRWDQQRLITVAQGLSAAIILTIATLAITENIEVWHLAVSAFVLGMSQSIDEPARTAFFPRLLPDRSHIPSAVPLISLAWSSTRVFAPSIAGFVIAAWGADASFLLSAAGAATMVAMLRFVHPNQDRPPSRGNMLRNLIEGVQYVRADEVYSKVILSAFVYATFLAGYVFILPVFADELGVGSKGLGVLTSAAGVGSLIGLGTFSFLHARFKPGEVIIIGMTLFSFALMGVAASHSFMLSVVLLGVTGVAHIYFQTSANVILQSTLEDRYRGRVMSLYGLLWSLMLLSGTLLNLSAEFVGPRYALGGGAVVVLVYVWGFLARSKALRHVTLEDRTETTKA
ncbi:MAG: MFS transporter [Chloroflexi bacterium]|nr:MFS transporter [Chloroflexota bacterium]MDA1174603.1 MFS transporter [Chloroflexota bacterium]